MFIHQVLDIRYLLDIMSSVKEVPGHNEASMQLRVWLYYINFVNFFNPFFVNSVSIISVFTGVYHSSFLTVPIYFQNFKIL